MEESAFKVQQLKELGFEKAASDIEKLKEFNRKCAIAYENFRYVKPEQISSFNSRLRRETEKKESWGSTYDKLVFTNIKSYSEVPPNDVLESLQKAKGFGCFDEFEIAKIASTQERVDPILFGKVNGCEDLFYIGQWDNDVKIEDILKDNEG